MSRKDPALGGFERERYFLRFVRSVDDLIDVFINMSISPYICCVTLVQLFAKGRKITVILSQFERSNIDTYCFNMAVYEYLND